MRFCRVTETVTTIRFVVDPVVLVVVVVVVVILLFCICDGYCDSDDDGCYDDDRRIQKQVS